jgi:hypothetical protein
MLNRNPSFILWVVHVAVWALVTTALTHDERSPVVARPGGNRKKPSQRRARQAYALLAGYVEGNRSALELEGPWWRS